MSRITKAQLEEKINELEEKNLKLLEKNKELVNFINTQKNVNEKLNNKNIQLSKKEEFFLKKISFLEDKISNFNSREIKAKERCKETISYYINLINKLKSELNTLQNKKSINLGRKPFEDNNIIELMYNLYLQGNSFNKIAQYLNNNKIYTKRGGTWAKSSVSLILKNNKNIKIYLNNEKKYKKFIELLEEKKKNKNQ